MTDVSSVVNHFAEANLGFIATTTGVVSSGATTMPLSTVSGLTDGAVFVGIIEPNDTKEQEFTGTVDVGGAQITNVVWTNGTNVDHANGVTVVDYVSATQFNMAMKGIEVSHNQDGTLKDGAVTPAKWTNPQVFVVYLAASDTTRPDTATTSLIPFDTADIDTASSFNTTTSIFTAQVHGVYLFGGVARADTTADNEISDFKLECVATRSGLGNVTLGIAYITRPSGGSTVDNIQRMSGTSRMVELGVGDTVEFRAACTIIGTDTYALKGGVVSDGTFGWGKLVSAL